MTRALIVDDEAPARDRLRRLLAAFTQIQIVGEARSGEEALRLVPVLAPDVLFLDVQMPELSGLDVAASLSDPAPALVFVTAHDQYAVGAFDAAALDYLLKPVEPERLARCIERLQQRSTTATLRPRPVPGQLLIADRGRTHVVAVAEILWLQAADNYVIVHTANRSPLLRRTLAALLTDLGAGFERCHRGAAVALAHVQALQVAGKGDATVLLRGGAQVPCSRQYRAGLRARLGQAG